jgi:hypothetical protein
MIRKPYASGYDMDRLRASADVVYEKDATTTYLGFCSPGIEATSDVGWSIMKIVVTADAPPVTTTFTWATGQCCYNLVFDNREDYDYYFKKF